MSKENEEEFYSGRNKKRKKAAAEGSMSRLAGLPFSSFSLTLRDQFSTLPEPQVSTMSSSPPPTQTDDVIVDRYKKLEKLLRHARESGDLSRLFRNKLVIDPTLNKESEPDGDRVAYSLRLATKQQIWDRMSSDLLTQEEIMEFYGILEKWADKTPKPLNSKWFHWVERGLRDRGVLVYEKYIDYVSFTKAKEEMHPKIREWLTTAKFMTLMSESDDKIFRRLPIIHLFNYVMKRVWLIQTRLGFINYDLDCQGYLTEEWMESYIRELLPTLQQLEGMDPALEPFYLCAASRKFFFFLDPRHIGKVQIVAIMSSMLLDEILELRDSVVRDTNWFGLYSLLRVYKHYVLLDTDANGMLSQEEFLKFNYSSCGASIYLTEAFADALFSEKMTYHGEMDFRAYIDFVLAMENKSEEQAISYFVKVLDIQGKGFLNSGDLHYFYKDVYKILSESNPEAPKFDDIKDEIFDMVKPVNPYRITAADLFKCGKGDLVIGMLIDAKSLDDYENREFVVTPQ